MENEPEITEQQALRLATIANQKATPEERELSIIVVVRDKETGKFGLMHLWNEEEVDKRQQLLDENLGGAAEWYKETVEEVREHTRVRRLAWEKEKKKYEIILPKTPKQ